METIVFHLADFLSLEYFAHLMDPSKHFGILRSSYTGQVTCQAKLATNLCVPFGFILRFMLISRYSL